MAEGRACGGKTQSIHSDIWNGSAVLGGARPIASGDGEGVRGRAGQSEPFDDIGRCPRNGKDDTSFPHRRCRPIAWVLPPVAGRMGVSNGYASTYKWRLLGQGVIGERPGGLLDFDIPLMRAYLSEFAQD